MTKRPAYPVVIDPSAIVAMIEGAPNYEQLLSRCMSSDRIQFSAAGFLEAAIVLDNRNAATSLTELDELLENLGVTIVPVTPAQARIARRAHRKYGRGSGHPARGPGHLTASAGPPTSS
ncbi:MAG: type II toxin-antitoxin system VapC family toxin [Nakamurella sp.]